LTYLTSSEVVKLVDWLIKFRGFNPDPNSFLKFHNYSNLEYFGRLPMSAYPHFLGVDIGSVSISFLDQQARRLNFSGAAELSRIGHRSSDCCGGQDFAGRFFGYRSKAAAVDEVVSSFEAIDTIDPTLVPPRPKVADRRTLFKRHFFPGPDGDLKAQGENRLHLF
jgi:hypothetical protein